MTLKEVRTCLKALKKIEAKTTCKSIKKSVATIQEILINEEEIEIQFK